MPHGHVYTIRHEATVATAITLLQLKAGPTTPFEILEAGIGQDSSTVSAQEKICLIRKTTPATVTAAAVGTHIFKFREGDPAPDLALGVAASGVIATAEGAEVAGELYEEGFNVLNGWKYLPLPENRIIVRAAGTIAMKFRTPPASQLWQMFMIIRELG